jgi:chromosome partitioning protein
VYYRAVARAIVLAGQKGGVGKTTAALCLATEAIERGLSVLLVDADPQGSARTWGDVAAEVGRKAPTVVAMGATMHRDGQLRRVADGYDLAIIDCPPRHGEIQRSALLIADLVILPCGPAAMDAWALAASVELVSEARGVRPDLPAYVLITRKQGHTALGKGARDVLVTSGLPVLRSELGYRVAYQEAIAAGQGVGTYAPRDAAAGEIHALYDEVRALLDGEGNDVQKTRRRSAKSAARR